MGCAPLKPNQTWLNWLKSNHIIFHILKHVLKHVLKISLLILDYINNTCTVCGTFVYTLICTCTLYCIKF